MTSASEVHLFPWVYENRWWLAWVVGGIAGMVIFWFKTIVNRFYSKEQVEDRIDTKLSNCKIAVDDDTKKILEEVCKLGEKVDHLDDRIREDAMANSEAHEKIWKRMTEK